MDSTKNEKARVLVSAEEERTVERQVMVWLSSLPELQGEKLAFESLDEGVPGIAVFSGEGAYITEPDILGGHKAIYPFSVVRRIIPGDSPDMRLDAVALLNGLGDRVMRSAPELGERISSVRVKPTTRGHYAGTDGGAGEDYEIKFDLTYEVD